MDQGAWNVAQNFAHKGEDVVNRIYDFVVEHKTTVAITALSTGLGVFFKHKPTRVNDFLKHYADAAKTSFPCTIAATALVENFQDD